MIRFRGDLAARLRTSASRLERSANGRFTEAVANAIWAAASPLRKDARTRAAQVLPRRGGLGARVARTPMPIRKRRFGRSTSVMIMALPGAVKDPEAINRGRVRHPVFGNWPEAGAPIQMVPPGWFTVPMALGAPAAREAIEKAIREEIEQMQG